mmetsp:Transcript_80855/g.262168  ORF Transcript_80855/g.262168 Transcript_80855/m.262168 type:complete len:421 (-) Transcript_80855:330-1592(-)
MALDPAPALIFTVHLLYLLPHYYLLNALILVDRKDAEWTMRSSLLQSQVFGVLAEMAWSAAHPRSVRPIVSSACALFYVCLQGIQLCLAFVAAEDVYTLGVALPLQCLALLALVPLQQVGHNYTLEKQISPMRYRILAWLTAVVLAVSALLSPAMASPWVAVPCAVLPALVVAVLLVATGRGEGAVDMSLSRSGERADPRSDPELLNVSHARAFMFLLLGCASGTLGESITDMATTLAIRRSLTGGRQDLALANQVAVFLSMSLAYWSETRPGGGAANRGGIFILAWASCQLFRGSAVHLLEAGTIGVPVLMAFVFLDKYTGPLGSGALDVALLAILRDGGASHQRAGKRGVRGTWLWTVRNAVARLERPICQLILLHTSGFPIQCVSCGFTAATCLGVLVVIWGGGPGREPVLSKAKSQ